MVEVLRAHVGWGDKSQNLYWRYGKSSLRGEHGYLNWVKLGAVLGERTGCLGGEGHYNRISVRVVVYQMGFGELVSGFSRAKIGALRECVEGLEEKDEERET